MEALEQDQSTINHEQFEQHNNSPNNQKSPEIISNDTSGKTPPTPKKKYPAFLSSPMLPPLLSSKPSPSTNRDDHLIAILSQDRSTFKSQFTSLYMHPTDYIFKLYVKYQAFFTFIAFKIMSPYQYWLDNVVKRFSLQFNFLRSSIYDLKTDENDPSFLSIAQKATYQERILIFYSTKYHRTKFLTIINTFILPQ